jgi:acyl carrier protein
VETTITPDEGAYAFEALLRHDRAYTGYAPVTTTPWLTALAQRSKFAELFQARDESLTDTSRFLAELHALPKEEWPTRLRRLVSDKLSKILRRSIDPDRPLSEYGLDSLANLELRNYVRDETAIRITPSHISTVNGLAGALYEYLTVDGTRGGPEPHVTGQITRIKSPSGP